ncbi:unnamed protein product [Callosobruchus maculatus]|uniref:G-protein coupled receptors family 3 profile domain-containing protein n=1 Tax=Callosobruchus maculatus TaxID=64391 RepID=A0A653C7E1_CALMS|nr:unnamed protein product [Callosobruchus maculatus]
MQQDICGHGISGVCSKLLPFNGSLFKNYLFNVSFEYEKELISFDENGDPPGRYDIMNFQRLANGSFDYVQVGGWNNHTLTLNEKAMQFGPNGRTVKSICSEDCPIGKYKSVQQGGKDKRCCWVCASCADGQIFRDGACMKCPLGFAPDEWKTECFSLPIEYVQWHDTQAIVAMIFASLGFISTLFTSIVFVKYNDTPIVKSSTRELCYIILAGMTVSHGSVFVILAKPSRVTCTLTRLLPGLSFAMIYAALLTKTNRIARILAGSKKRFPTKKPLFMSATAQVFITFCLISVEIFIAGSMHHYQPPNEYYVYLSYKTLLQCNTTLENILVPLSFDFFLILLCTVYAVKTRNVPENFNEAKFIGFAMYTTCVIWIAFVPIYFGSDSKVITMCICVTLSATVTWIFLFVPKMYIILLQPEKNNRAYFTTAKIRCHIGSKVTSVDSNKSCSNSWRESTTSLKEGEKYVKDFIPPQKRTLSCQTGTELLQVILNPRALFEVCSPPHDVYHIPRIIEKNCCESDNCQLKNITIKLPDKPLNNPHCKYQTMYS